jgi:hypothetical protein
LEGTTIIRILFSHGDQQWSAIVIILKKELGTLVGRQARSDPKPQSFKVEKTIPDFPVKMGARALKVLSMNALTGDPTASFLTPKWGVAKVAKFIGLTRSKNLLA